MKRAFNPKNKGKLHAQLGYPQGTTLPPGLLKEIGSAVVGNKVRGHIVTPLLKRRVDAALNARRR